MTIRETLLAMGYREAKKGQWLKPIGYVLFSYHEEKGIWSNWFKSAVGKIERYESKIFQNEIEFGSYLDQLKGFECWTRTDMFIHGDSAFELSALDI